jgi:transcriptional regulator with XRE-family HTH domain
MPKSAACASNLADCVAKFWFCDLERATVSGVDDRERGADLPAQGRPELPERRVTINAVVSLNLGFFRKAAGLGQQELGDRIGWGKTVVSTAERSFEAARVRNFSADDLVALSHAVGVPLAAWFLPPEDDGIAFRYVLDIPGWRDPPLRDVLPYLYDYVNYADCEEAGSSRAMEAYRRRAIAVGALPRAVDDPDLEKAARILSLAQRTAEDAIAAAQGESREVLERVQREAEQALHKAQGLAEQITGDAAERAKSLEYDAQERHRQAMHDLIWERDRLERRIDDLRAFEREYRGRLLKMLEGHFRSLWEDTEGVDPDQLLEAMRRRQAQGGGDVRAVLLGEDGLYDVVSLGQVAEAAEEDGEEGAPGGGEALSAVLMQG